MLKSYNRRSTMEFEPVFIGDKPIKTYVNAGKWALDKKKPLKILARGNNIKTAVDVAEIIKRELNDCIVEITTRSEEVSDEDRKVSVITIIIKEE